MAPERQGVPHMRAIWIVLYYPELAQGNELEPLRRVP